MQLATLIVLGAAVVGSAIIHLIKVFKELNRSEKIPGPTLLPYIGRIHDLPINFMWLKFKEWAVINYLNKNILKKSLIKTFN